MLLLSSTFSILLFSPCVSVFPILFSSCASVFSLSLFSSSVVLLLLSISLILFTTLPFAVNCTVTLSGLLPLRSSLSSHSFSIIRSFSSSVSVSFSASGVSSSWFVSSSVILPCALFIKLSPL